MAKSIVRLGELQVESYTEGKINNYITFSPLPYSKQHSSGIDGDIVMASTPTIEIVDADLDLPISSGYTYAYSIAPDNKPKIAFEKSLFSNRDMAITAMQCVSINYELGNLQTNGNLYILTIKNSLGEEIHKTTPLNLSQINNVISIFNETRETMYGGFLKFEIVPDYRVT